MKEKQAIFIQYQLAFSHIVIYRYKVVTFQPFSVPGFTIRAALEKAKSDLNWGDTLCVCYHCDNPPSQHAK